MYTKLSKEEKKKVRLEFAKTKKGTEILPILNRLVLEGIASLIFGIVIAIFIFLTHPSIFYWIVMFSCFIGGTTFLLAQATLRKKQYNTYVYKKKRK